MKRGVLPGREDRPRGLGPATGDVGPTGAAAQATCAADRGQALPSEAGPSHPWLVLAATVLAASLSFVDGSVVNVALPAIQQSLTADPGAIEWVVAAYLLPLGALLLLGGAAGDRFGRRRLMMAGVVVFAVASLGCALAPDFAVLLLGRFLQGVSSAMVMPNCLAILGDSFAGERKLRGVGIWAAAGAAANAVGPVLGGWLVDLGSWRSIFLLNMPLAAGALLLAWRFVPDDEGRHDDAFDVLGGALATLGLAALTSALSAGSAGGGLSVGPPALAAVAAGLLVAFLVVERRRGDQAMMPLALFASRSFVGLSLLTVLLYGALGAMLVLVPYMLMEAGHYSGTDAGAALLPLPLMLAVASPLAGTLTRRFGARTILAISPLAVGAGFLLALRIDATPDYWLEVFPAILAVAVGMAGAVAPLTAAVLSAVGPRYTGAAAGFNSAVARTGSLVATASLGSVLAAQGDRLVSAFHVGMAVSAVACAAAAVSAFALVGL